MTDLPAFDGPQALAAAIQMPPTLQLSFYPFGILLRRTTEAGGMMEYAVDPAQVAEALATRTRFDTGVLHANTICVQAEGLQHTVVEFRPPQKTALYLDGSDAPLRVALPGLLLIRVVTGESVRYALFAVKCRPATLDAALFQPPLPNVYAEGAICWGSVTRVSPEALAGTDLAEDWRLFLGSPFSSHSLSGKSRSEPLDVRKKLTELEARKARTYPKRDLVPCNVKLGEVLARLTRRSD